MNRSWNTVLLPVNQELFIYPGTCLVAPRYLKISLTHIMEDIDHIIVFFQLFDQLFDLCLLFCI